MSKDYSERIKRLFPESSTDDGNDVARRRRVELTRIEMLSQGEAISETYESNKSLLEKSATAIHHRSISRLIIVGCGDSWFSGIATRAAFERLTGIHTEAIQAFDFTNYYFRTIDTNTAVIGISSSGTTDVVINALKLATERGALSIGITNSQGSLLTQIAESHFVVSATRKGWPTQASTATMVLLLGLAIEIASLKSKHHMDEIQHFNKDITNIHSIINTLIDDCNRQVEALANDWLTKTLILFSGAGPYFATASFGAAKIKELSPVHSYAIPLEEYHHYRSQKQADPMILVAADQTSYERALDTLLVSHTLAAQTAVIVSDTSSGLTDLAHSAVTIPTISEILMPVIASIPLHLFSYHFASARFKAGLGYLGNTG